MKILALEVEQPTAQAADFAPHLRAEAEQAYALYAAGVLRELYFRADRASAVLVLECASLEAARAALATLPLVAAGLIDFELIPLAPYPGFARLFAAGDRRPRSDG
jgi:muconolactone delta-isomerase